MLESRIAEENKVIIEELKSLSNGYKEKLRSLNLREDEVVQYLGEILYYQVGGLEPDLKQLRSKYKNSPISKYIEITYSYLETESGAEPFIKEAGYQDASVLYFLIDRLDWSIESLPDYDLMIQILSYHLKIKEKIEEKQLRKDYKKLFRLSVARSLFLLGGQTKEIDFFRETFMSFAPKEANELIERLEESLLFDSFTIANLLSQLYENRSEYAHYKDMGWFYRLYLRYLVKSMQPVLKEIGQLAKNTPNQIGNSIVHLNTQRNSKKRKRRK
ncbi:hypothetical protein LFX25_03205 [Leptospira sp. FAT2]|uniref:hypothetical protein n=1 Tax=Leptospira sanjuanensis TaxID=2879643 RepID=UPI001EE8F285|nr:hypothetical protein [Leptospira sanjuanensis]MCG6166866.1 hypothetical protein [Leptospira sanjuanensis]MCG6192248.1 hypothetical protein [Leptospira sanjuanensis]